MLEEVVLISYNLARKFAKVDKNNGNTNLAVKAKEGVNLDDLEDEITGLLR